MARKCLSILGLGLLGGSLGMAAKAITNTWHVVGYSHRDSTRQRALAVGAVDEVFDSAEQAVKSADLVVLCTPVGQLGAMLEAIKGHLPGSAVVTDVGSTKQTVVRDGQASLSGRFVGSHPMAGSEKRGVDYARADLFQGALCIVTPTEQSDARAVKVVEDFWRVLGMRLTRLAPEEHDRLLAEISHLPHVLAAALVAMQQPRGLELAGKGFIDATRIAGGDGALWRDIVLDNAGNVLASIQKLRGELDRLQALLERGDGEALTAWLDAQAMRRQELVRQKLSELDN